MPTSNASSIALKDDSGATQSLSGEVLKGLLAPSAGGEGSATSWVTFDGAVAPAAAFDPTKAFNVSGITRSAAGTYTITLAKGLGGVGKTDVAVIGTAAFTVAAPGNLTVTCAMLRANTISVEVYSTSTALTDAPVISIVTFGGK